MFAVIGEISTPQTFYMVSIRATVRPKYNIHLFTFKLFFPDPEMAYWLACNPGVSTLVFGSTTIAEMFEGIKQIYMTY